MSTRLSRRAMLRGAGVALALPALECMFPAFAAGRTVPSGPRRMVAINFALSFHPPNLIPEQAGRDYELTPYLKPLAGLRLGLITEKQYEQAILRYAELDDQGTPIMLGEVMIQLG